MEEVFKRESYLNDAFCFAGISGMLILSYYALPLYFPRFILDSSALMLLLLAIHIGVWLLVVMYFLNGYFTSLVVNDAGIAVRYRKGGWSCAWSEIDEWTSTVDSDGIREIKLTVDGRRHTLPSAIIDNKNYRQYIKTILRERCGEPAKVEEWMTADDANGWSETV